LSTDAGSGMTVNGQTLSVIHPNAIAILIAMLARLVPVTGYAFNYLATYID